MYLRRFLLLCLYTALLRWGMIFLHLHYSQIFFLLLHEVTTIFFFFFMDSTVPVPFKSSVNATYLEADALLPSFYFLISHARRGLMPSAYIAIAMMSPCTLYCPFLWFYGSPTLNIKICCLQVAVVVTCWYWWVKSFCIAKKYFPIYCIEGIWSVYH